MRLYVVNPKLVGVMVDRYGFEVESEYSHGVAHLTRY